MQALPASYMQRPQLSNGQILQASRHAGSSVVDATAKKQTATYCTQSASQHVHGNTPKHAHCVHDPRGLLQGGCPTTLASTLLDASLPTHISRQSMLQSSTPHQQTGCCMSTACEPLQAATQQSGPHLAFWIWLILTAIAHLDMCCCSWPTDALLMQLLIGLCVGACVWEGSCQLKIMEHNQISVSRLLQIGEQGAVLSPGASGLSAAS